MDNFSEIIEFWKFKEDVPTFCFALAMFALYYFLQDLLFTFGGALFVFWAVKSRLQENAKGELDGQ